MPRDQSNNLITLMTIIHKAKDQKPTNDNPNIYCMDFHIDLKKKLLDKSRKTTICENNWRYISQYPRLNHLNFICRSAGELTFQYCYPHNSIPKRDIQHVHIWHKVSYTGTQNIEGKENAKQWNLTNVTSLAMPRRISHTCQCYTRM